MEGGIDAAKLLPLRLKVMILGSEEKSNWVRFPSRLSPARFIPLMVFPASQVIPVQLQMFFRLERDQEPSEGEDDDKEFFHLMRASASVTLKM